MDLFLAQNHAAMTHLPIAASIMAALAGVAGLFVNRREFYRFWAMLTLAAFLTVLPTLATGIAAAKGRYNEEGQPYIQKGLLVSQTPANSRIFNHQIFGTGGAIVAAFLAFKALAQLRGREPNRILIAVLTVILAVLWAAGGHLGGKELWEAYTFPVFQ